MCELQQFIASRIYCATILGVLFDTLDLCIFSCPDNLAHPSHVATYSCKKKFVNGLAMTRQLPNLPHKEFNVRWMFVALLFVEKASWCILCSEEWSFNISVHLLSLPYFRSQLYVIVSAIATFERSHTLYQWWVDSLRKVQVTSEPSNDISGSLNPDTESKLFQRQLTTPEAHQGNDGGSTLPFPLPCWRNGIYNHHLTC